MKKITYDPIAIEERWQQVWEEAQLFQNQPMSSPGDKEYLLFAFAYPSGSGLHVGHVESKTALDIMARFRRMQGKDVFLPVGWDAFGLPAENYAIKTGVHPRETTRQAIDTFRQQIKRLGISYDWQNEISTSHPEYYRWTQWLFLQLYNKNLAYRDTGLVNWCPSCQTVLANEQVVAGHCERCGTEVIQKELEQWYFKITKYQDELLAGLDQVDWPESTKQHQRNWIGKKTGVEISYPVEGTEENLVCFTTRPDTNFGATFIVLAPEHSFVKQIIEEKVAAEKQTKLGELRAYVDQATKKSNLDRQIESKQKTGIFTGFYATNQLTGERLPIWVSDFVLVNFGTGAVVGVPGHDLRDFEFAQAMRLTVTRVVEDAEGNRGEIDKTEDVFEGEGIAMNSDFLDGLTTVEAQQRISDHLEEKGWGKRVTTYKLRDWLISRQRYWGAPIPIVYDPEGKPHPVKDEHLPWQLPTDVDFKPEGESPLKSSVEFVERTEKLYGKGWRPEFDTMDTFVDSSWYFLRYCDARNTNSFAGSDKLKDWLPVDLYMIGPEHIVLHLLYARFFTKFLRDEGLLTVDEPFTKMRHQGMILGLDGKKMSKSKGNVIAPEVVIEKYGADTLRVYEMFMGPLESDKPWDDRAVAGVSRFLNRIYSLFQLEVSSSTDSSLEKKLHQTLKKVTEDIPALKFNTAIAAMMELINSWEKIAREKNETGVSKSDLLIFIKLLAPFAPFLAEELYNQLSGLDHSEAYQGVHIQDWPEFSPQLAQEEQVAIAVQVNGKLRAELLINHGQLEDKELVLKLAKENEIVKKWLTDKQLVKEIYVPGRIVSFVTN